MNILHPAATGRTPSRPEVPSPSRLRKDPPYLITTLEAIVTRISQKGILKTTGFLVIEHSRRRELEESYGSLSLVKSRRYGDTSVSIYSLGDLNG